MFGAIIGDVVGSVYEFRPHKSKGFPLFSNRFGKRSHFTDDTVMTLAVAHGLADGGTPDAFIDAMKQFGAEFPHAGYGHKFRKWLKSDDREPYNSWGNGSAMRVSPCAWYATTLAEVERLAEVSAAVTHHHPEGIKGAKAVAAAIHLARAGKSKIEIRDYVESTYGYDLHRTLAEIRPRYKFDSSARGSVPEAIIAFLESTDFEDAIRNAVSLGGDADTQAAISGSVAEAAYGIPLEIEEEAKNYLPFDFTEFINYWFHKYANRGK